jgi:hypothetical protein
VSPLYTPTFPNPASSTADPDPLIEPYSASSTASSLFSDDEWWYEGDGESHGPPYTPTSSGYGLDHGLTGAHAPQPNPNDLPPPKPTSPKEFGQANDYQVQQVQQPNRAPSDPGPSDPELTDPELHLDHQSLSTDSDSEPGDPQAAIYAAKGKAKLSRRISGTARNVGNAAQRELQSDERSLDPGE